METNIQKHKFPYQWNLKDGYPAKGIDQHNLKVFGTFICGGGSSMGYKLAGFDHLGGVEIDPKVAEIYKLNHNPKYLFIEDIREFNKRKDLPEELFHLDILDGSPPCSSFSMAGNREKDWGKKKRFREGQALQTLDDLFFDYIALAKRLQPKVVIAENVKGLIQGNAKSYVKKIKREFENAGYKVQLFLLNAASMGVPQKRERVFFICQRKDLNFPDLKLNFNERPILFSEIKKLNPKGPFKEIIPSCRDLWEKAKQGKGLDSVHPTKSSFFSKRKLADKEVVGTLTAHCSEDFLHSTEKRCLNEEEIKLIGAYPLDYNFKDIDCGYLIGMSVPPVMTAQIAHQVYLQWLKNK
jgi:DNA (cytosine-5-)-methyltransferase|nr:MAG TPA: Cytosine specific methyltransferase [Caudoviricetes sp.]